MAFNPYVSLHKPSSIKEWYKSPIQTDDGFAKDTKGNPITHGHFVCQVYNDIMTIVNKHNYNINDKKKFKNELIRYLYKISDDTHSEYG